MKFGVKSDAVCPQHFQNRKMASGIAKWLDLSLQGLVFWIGHRRSLFSDYPLPEGALVAEACNLIQANLPSNLVLLPELLYRNLVPNAKRSSVKYQDDRSRADLVICSEDDGLGRKEGNISKHVEYVIEVKRASAPKKDINNDLYRLHKFLKSFPKDTKPRALLLVVSESGAPKCFVTNGKAKRGQKNIPDCDGHCSVRRVVKASFSSKSKAHYACVIEVFCKD